MKKYIHFFITSLLVCGLNIFTASAQDGVYTDAQTLQANEAMLGVQSAIYTDVNDFMLYLRAGYGIQDGLALHGKLGLLARDLYGGGHVEYQLAGEPDDAVSFALIGGLYHFREIGLKIGAVLGKQIDSFSLYSGLTYEPVFTDNVRHPLMLPIGIEIPFSDGNTNFLMETDISINSDGGIYEAVNFGIKFYL